MIEAGDLDEFDVLVRGYQELDGGIGEGVGFGFRDDARVGAFGLRLQIAELLLEVQFTEKEGEGGAHVVAFLELHFFGAIFGRGVEPEEFPIADEELAFGLVVGPAHFPGFAQDKRTAFAPLGPPGRRIVFMEKDLESFGAIIPGLDAFEQRVERRVAGESRHGE